ncbi:hypothetical protein TCAL_02675 [Tigriopus californicus]|uniref:PPM-type phosphatase domain-containing protein n=2 Tax=Tigriopus californicus TaxID=6832 RepID=A0A553PF20_TIGCA|nr:hypothetical protein TCAL_02675 [Tigriopus californicus]|eukprot:TCALIF_02675-PA protein Name:"Similar to ppm1h Protein phosphatase 1H (Danio rerio)" AED:0.43 eAED:0.43 QI:0/-1/0/1/-1/1/1/0/382
MLAKMLKRKVSRSVMEAPDPSALNVGGTPLAPVLEQITESETKTKTENGEVHVKVEIRSPVDPDVQYQYQRPDLLQGYSEADWKDFASHFKRPVVGPRAPLPAEIGYAEAMNAGKSKLNEDQATVHEGQLKGMNGVIIPYLYVGVFDGHGGAGAAVKVSKDLHGILHEGLEDVLPYMVSVNKPCPNVEVEELSSSSDDDNDDDEEEDEFVEMKMTLDELICGSLESSFWAMDRLILNDKAKYKITGGTTAVVALFICGKLYVANAGDSRAALYLPGHSTLHPMSRDHTPFSDRQRIQHIAYQRPELTRHPKTKEKLYNRHLLSRKVTKDDIGSTVMYKDFYMSGWSCRDVSSDDVHLLPIISGKHIKTSFGKRQRLQGFHSR